MPDRHLPRRARITIRVLATLTYAALTVTAAGAVVDAPGDTVGMVGLNATMVLGAILGVSALVCAFSQATHLWLLERAALPFVVVALTAYDVTLWARMDDLGDITAPGLVSVIILGGIIRVVMLETFARQQPKRRGPPTVAEVP